jgi:hypothetical protein
VREEDFERAVGGKTPQKEGEKGRKSDFPAMGDDFPAMGKISPAFFPAVQGCNALHGTEHVQRANQQ